MGSKDKYQLCTTIQIVLGFVLQRARLRHDLTQKEIGARVKGKLGQSGCSRIENGQVDTSFRQFVIFASAIGWHDTTPAKLMSEFESVVSFLTDKGVKVMLDESERQDGTILLSTDSLSQILEAEQPQDTDVQKAATEEPDQSVREDHPSIVFDLYEFVREILPEVAWVRNTSNPLNVYAHVENVGWISVYRDKNYKWWWTFGNQEGSVPGPREAREILRKRLDTKVLMED